MEEKLFQGIVMLTLKLEDLHENNTYSNSANSFALIVATYTTIHGSRSIQFCNFVLNTDTLIEENTYNLRSICPFE
jgi:hypothetical protein